MTGERDDSRTVLAITGSQRIEFLQGLVTNDLGKLAGGLVYAALLTPQGKYLADFFLAERGEAVLLDIKAEFAPAIVRKLTMYKLRSDVAIAEAPLHVQRGLGEAPADALADPRHAALGWRRYAGTPGGAPEIDWAAIRVAHCIPETGIELVPEETFILEAGFAALDGVDFRKGCFVGQEIVARMHHKTELTKGLETVAVTGEAPVGTAIEAEGKPAGTLYTQAKGQGIAYLRRNRARETMTAGAAGVTRLTPA